MAEPVKYPEKVFLILYVEAWGNDYEDFNAGDDVYVDFHDAVTEFQAEAKRRGMTKIEIDYNSLSYAVARYDEEHENYYSGLDKTLTIQARNLIAPQKRRLVSDVYPEFDPANHTVKLQDIDRKRAEEMFIHKCGFVSTPTHISADCVIWDDPKEVYESIRRALEQYSKKTMKPNFDGFPVMDAVDHTHDAEHYLTHFPDCVCSNGVIAVSDADGHIDYQPCQKCKRNG